MIPIRISVDKWLNSECSDEEKIKDIESDPELYAKFMLVHNIFTEVAIAYKFNLIDKKLILVTWGDLIPGFFKKLEFYYKYKDPKREKMGVYLESLVGLIAKFRAKNDLHNL